VRDGVDEAMHRRRTMCCDEGAKGIGNHRGNEVLPRYGGSVAHIEVRSAVAALCDQSLAEHPRQFRKHGGVGEILKPSQAAMKVRYGLRTVLPEIFENRGLTGP
jgi:hypothetical protein